MSTHDGPSRSFLVRPVVLGSIAAVVLTLVTACDSDGVVPPLEPSSSASSAVTSSATESRSTATPDATATTTAATTSCRRAPVYKGRKTRFGANLSTHGVSLADAVRTSDRQFGRMGAVRVFDPTVPPSNTWKRRAGALRKRSIVTSFRMPPQQVIAGVYDAQMRRFFNRAPENAKVFWSYYHEPEPQIDAGVFTYRQYRLAWRHLVNLARGACNPKLFPTLILTGWTAERASGRSWRDYYPGRRYISVMGWDPYNSASRAPSSYVRPVDLFRSVSRASRAAGKPMGIAETGSRIVAGDNGAGRAKWLRRLGTYFSNRDAAFVTYFNSIGTSGADYRLRDRPSINAWDDVVG
ncbi:exported hypothetical protein [metagenome]|uniref:GH26 domain-containing protein n=1 Tax=metagenome TaxID=256318 RepID=A0A2P2BZD1_9ZZZZ